MFQLLGKYTYAQPEHKKTVETEFVIQNTIEKVVEKHGKVIGDTSAMRHFTLGFGCTGNHVAIAAAVKEIVPVLMKKHGKESFTMHVQQFMFCPGPAPIVGVTPLPGSTDWNFFTELQAALLLNSKVNAAHPDYAGSDKIVDKKNFPAGFDDMLNDLQVKFPTASHADLLGMLTASPPDADACGAAHKWMWPHMSAFRLDDKESIGSFGTLNREALDAKYGWIEKEPIDVEIPIRIIGASMKSNDGHKFRMEIEL